MDIIVNRTHEDGEYKALDMTCSTTNAHVFISTVGINVLCKNASHKAWKGMGRYFRTWEEALEGYKSSPMKAMIRFAKAELTSEKKEVTEAPAETGMKLKVEADVIENEGDVQTYTLVEVEDGIELEVLSGSARKIGNYAKKEYGKTFTEIKREQS